MLSAFIAYVEKHGANPAAIKDLRAHDCLPENAVLSGEPDPEAGFCATGGEVDGMDLQLDYRKAAPSVSRFKLTLPKGTPGIHDCEGIPHTKVERRWNYSGKNTWCSIGGGKLKGWQVQVRAVDALGEYTTDIVWLTSPGWMSHGGPWKNAWQILKEQAE